MSSSDSEEDCYGNIALKLQSIKNKFKEEKNTGTTNCLDDSFPTVSRSRKVDKVIEIEDINSRKDCEVPKADSDVEEISLDAIIAKNSKKRRTRSSKRDADISTDNILPGRGRKKSKFSNIKSSGVVANSDVSHLNTTIPSASVETLSGETTNSTNITSTSVNTSRGRGRGRGSRRGRRGRGASNFTPTSSNIQTTNVNTSSSLSSNTPILNTSSNNLANDLQIASDFELATRLACFLDNGPRRNSRGRRPRLQDYYQVLHNRASHSNQMQSSIPTYSVGNTDEYPDECYNQALFTAQNKKTEEVIVLGENELENDSIDENEELSVKVYWQNCEVIKFTIRRFQKFTQLFDFFANRENVSHDKLFFTYNDKILKIDDTPDSINYSIVKFIDGGIINQSVSEIVQKDRGTVKNGIALKFQCQNVKKPFETTIRPDEKLAVAFMMCAEHFEKPLDKLKFHFDGDLISGKNTPRELELEGGECIDVTVYS